MWTVTIHVTVKFKVNCYDSCEYYFLFFWMEVKKCTVCDIKLDKDNYK